MKTVRFVALVESGGKPDAHLLFVKPEADKILQKAIKSKKVVTVYQSSVGSKADHGEVGFHPGVSRQYLVFPRSIGAFDGRKVIGIKYNLLESVPIPKSQQAEKPVPPPPKKRPNHTKVAKQKPEPNEEEHDLVPPEKLVKFPEPLPREDDEDHEVSEAIEEIKAQVRKAMGELEKGKQVAAFNLLKRIVAD